MLDVMRMRFKEDGTFRMMVYAVALVLTIVNCPLVSVLAAGGLGRVGLGFKFLLLLATAVSGVLTLGLYYVSDSIGVFIGVVSFLTKIATGFTAVLAALTSWMLGLGILLQVIMPPIIMVAGALMGLMLGMMLPVVFVPLMGFIARLGQPQRAGRQSKKAVDAAN